MSAERSSEYYDDIYSRYPEKYECEYKDSEYFNLWSKVAALIPRGIPIVELGCGTGQFAQMLIDLGVTYQRGFDFSHYAIDLARKRGIGNFQRIDLIANKVEGDIFLALEILEHCKDYKLIENLGLGKEIIFTVPDFNDASHVRYFHSVNDVVSRYTNVIKFEHIQKFERWFICKGVTI